MMATCPLAEQRTKMYGDRSKVIAEMADTFYIFFQEYIFQPGNGRAIQSQAMTNI